MNTHQYASNAAFLGWLKAAADENRLLVAVSHHWQSAMLRRMPQGSYLLVYEVQAVHGDTPVTKFKLHSVTTQSSVMDCVHPAYHSDAYAFLSSLHEALVLRCGNPTLTSGTIVVLPYEDAEAMERLRMTLEQGPSITLQRSTVNAARVSAGTTISADTLFL